MPGAVKGRLVDLAQGVQSYPQMQGLRDEGHGYDRFGLHEPSVRLARRVFDPLYNHYFRVRSRGHEHIPKEGPAIVVANHSGTLPLDGVMLYLDIVRHTGRIPRPIADRFVPLVPAFGTFLARVGTVIGTRRNMDELLGAGELLLLFPEGLPGIAKTFDKAYQLQGWRPGHVEFAMRHGAPVVPAGLVGAEEQMPLLHRLDWLRALGLPYLPVVASPIPLPTRYHIAYGPPVRFGEELSSHDPAHVRAGAERTREAVDSLLQQGLAERGSVFA